MPDDRHRHTKLITEAAVEVLAPLGVQQRGGSRTWLDDRNWWACVVEFQPSSFSRGSYLNVGCMWLWGRGDHITFDEGNRIEEFHEFHSEADFEPVARYLAERAAQEVLRYRTLFTSPRAVADFYSQPKPRGLPLNLKSVVRTLTERAPLRLRGNPNPPPTARSNPHAHAPATTWECFHAGIACGLAGIPELADQYLGQASFDDRHPLHRDVLDDFVSLKKLAADPIAFQQEIEARIHRKRAALKLPELDGSPFGH